MADATAVKALVKHVTGSKADGGLGETIDILLNCGGIQRRGKAEDFTDQAWDDVMQVNLNALYVLSRDVGKHMLDTRSGEAGQKKHRGKIINIASMNSFHGGFQTSPYTASKHAVMGLTKALSNEWAGKGINVNAVAPGRHYSLPFSGLFS